MPNYTKLRQILKSLKNFEKNQVMVLLEDMDAAWDMLDEPDIKDEVEFSILIEQYLNEIMGEKN